MPFIFVLMGKSFLHGFAFTAGSVTFYRLLGILENKEEEKPELKKEDVL